MACTVHGIPPEPPPGRLMTRCECAGVPFEDLARSIRAEGLSLDEACRRTACGQTCTACLPDLQRYLSQAG